jgi:transposase
MAGTLAARVRGGTKRHLLEGHTKLVESLVATRPDITLNELRARLAGEGIAAGRSSVSRFLLALGLTHKKRRSMPPNRSGRMWRRRAKSGARASRR